VTGQHVSDEQLAEWARRLLPDALNAPRLAALVADLRAAREENQQLQKLLDLVAGVAASSIPDESLRGHPMAAVVDLSVTLSRAEAQVVSLQGRIDAAIEAAQAVVPDERREWLAHWLTPRLLGGGSSD
jgi:hypothetical protein